MADLKSDDGQLRTMHLFAGAGGGILADMLLGHRPVCAVEIDRYAASVLVARQNDGSLPPFPVWDDVRTFRGEPWRGRVDCISGGFPCQDISAAGKGVGITGERSGLWKEFARIIGEVRPRYAFIENSPLLAVRGLDVVLSDLAAMGYDAKWGVVGADSVGAPHERERIWIIGFDTNQSHAGGIRVTTRQDSCSIIGPTSKNQQKQSGWKPELGAVDVAQRFHSYADALRVLHGVANRVDRLKAIGNGQVPQCAALAWEILSNP